MPTECSAVLFEFARVAPASEVILPPSKPATTERPSDRFARCFTDRRSPELVEHKVATLVGQRVFGLALGYEAVLDHDELRHDPMMAVLAGKLAARRKGCAPVAGKSTLNRLELGKPAPTAYHKIGHASIACGLQRVVSGIQIENDLPRRTGMGLDK